MAAAHPPEFSPRERRQRSQSPDPGSRSRSDRDREKREHRSERWFSALFVVVIVFTLAYLVARSPVAQLINHG